MPVAPQKATADDSLLLYAELGSSQIRAVQRRLKAGELHRISPGVVSALPRPQWPQLIARERNRVLAALFPGAVIAYGSAFAGGIPVDGVMHLAYSYGRRVALPGLLVVLIKGPGKAPGDTPIGGRDLHFPSNARMLMDNLSISRTRPPRSVGRDAVEERLLTMCESRGEDALVKLRDEARELAPLLRLEREFAILDGLLGSILGTRPKSQLGTVAGKAWADGLPFDRHRLELFEQLAAVLRATPLKQPPAAVYSEAGRSHFAFLESYFSNFIEGTEFDVQEARGFVLEGRPIAARPKDSHDVLGVFRQAFDPGWANQTLAAGEPVLEQLRARHADEMKERPETGPGEFKDRPNYAGNTAFVLPKNVRGTLVLGSKLMPSIPPGIARALYAMFLVSEVHPFNDGNGRLARLVMNAELSVVDSCRIIVPTLFREEYFDCLRVLTRDGDARPYLAAMQRIHEWSASFSYESLDEAIALMRACNAFERSRAQFRLLFPADLASQEKSGPLRKGGA